MTDSPPPTVFSGLSTDGRILFTTRTIRLFGYGLLAVVLVLYLAQLGLTVAQIGLLLSLTLVGDILVSGWVTTRADRIGRRKMLLVGAGLMIAAGIVFALTHYVALLILAATIGVISPNGNEVGPFLSIEQAGLANAVSAARRTMVFSWYNLAGSFATALGALTAGAIGQAMHHAGYPALTGYRAIVIVYACLGFVLLALFSRLSANIEAPKRAADATDPPHGWSGLHSSHRIVLKLAGLFALDAFGGGLVMQSIIAYWLAQRFQLSPGLLGTVFFCANVAAGFSALLAGRLADRIGLINTMVFTHIPSNIFLILIPFMPNSGLAIAMLVLRFSISQMDVPTRQAYTMAVVKPDERSAAGGITAIARSVGAAAAPSITGAILAREGLVALPFVLAGGIKIAYDLLLYQSFKSHEGPEGKV